MRWLLALAVLFLVGCAAGTHELVVQVVTDMTPLVEFDALVVAAPSAAASESMPARTGVAYDRAVRVATRSLAAEGPVEIDVALVLRGVEVVRAHRRVRVVGPRTVVTVRVDRACVGVTCVDALASACLGGRCVALECTPETPEACPPGECGPTAGGATCTASSIPCVETECAPEGVCIDAPRHDRCGAGEVCDDPRGCVLVGSDAGAGDAGVSDAATDGGPLAAFSGWFVMSRAPTPGGATAIAARNGRVFFQVGCRASDDLGGGPITGVGDVDACIVALDGATGAFLWQRAIGSVGAETPGGIAANDDAVFASYGYVTDHQVDGRGPGPSRGLGDLAVARLRASDGATEWVVRTGADTFGAEVPGSAAVTTTGPLVVSAALPESGSTAPFVPFLARLDDLDGHSIDLRLMSSARVGGVGSMDATFAITWTGAYESGEFGNGTAAAPGVFVARYNLPGINTITTYGDSSGLIAGTDVADRGTEAYVVGGLTADGTLGGTSVLGPSNPRWRDAFASRVDGFGAVSWIANYATRIASDPHVVLADTRVWMVVSLATGGTIDTLDAASSSLGLLAIEAETGLTGDAASLELPMIVADAAYDLATGMLYVLGLVDGSFTYRSTPYTTTGPSSMVIAFRLPP